MGIRSVNIGVQRANIAVQSVRVGDGLTKTAADCATTGVNHASGAGTLCTARGGTRTRGDRLRPVGGEFRQREGRDRNDEGRFRINGGALGKDDGPRGVLRARVCQVNGPDHEWRGRFSTAECDAGKDECWRRQYAGGARQRGGRGFPARRRSGSDGLNPASLQARTPRCSARSRPLGAARRTGWRQEAIVTRRIPPMARRYPQVLV